MLNDVIDPRPFATANRSMMAARPGEPRRVCSQCGGTVEVITVTRKTTTGRQQPTKIGACVRCAQWFNEAGLGELSRDTPSES